MATNIRAFGFISYAHRDPEAVALFQQFWEPKGRDLTATEQDEIKPSMTAVRGSGQRLPQEVHRRAEFLVRQLIGAEPEVEILTAPRDWLDSIYS